jgi:hypothetical protein
MMKKDQMEELDGCDDDSSLSNNDNDVDDENITQNKLKLD